MKWFKHLSTARNDEKIARLEDVAGLEGYGFYFKILEIIAEQMDEKNNFSVEYSVNIWAKKCNILPAKFKKLSKNCEEIGLFLVENSVKTDKKLSKNSSEIYKISCPKLLKNRDNHTKNLQVNCKQDKEKDKDKERE